MKEYKMKDYKMKEDSLLLMWIWKTFACVESRYLIGNAVVSQKCALQTFFTEESKNVHAWL